MTVSLNELSSVYREFISEEDSTPEAVAQRVTQMVKAIRYRARKEASPLNKAFNDYIGSVNATSVERQAVKEKLGLTGGAVHREEYVDEAKNVHGDIEIPKKNLGKLVKKAVKRIDTDVDGDVDKNDPSAGEFGEFVPKPNGKGRVYTGSKKVRNESSYYDPMEDPDFDHDEAEKNRGVSGKNNPKGGKALGKKKKNVKEGFSNWRQDLSEVMDEVEASKEIKEKKVKNKVVINPPMREAFEEIGGTILEVVEVEEGLTDLQRRRYLGRNPGESKERLKRSNERKDKKAALAAMQKQYKGMKAGIYSSYEPEGEQLDEVINMKKADMGDVVKDFYKSDAPQFKGKSKEKRRQMAIAAKLTAERGGRKLGEGATEMPMSPQELSLLRKKTAIDMMIAKKRQQALQKAGNSMKESAEDRLRDRRMERGGVDGNTRYDLPPAKKLSNAELGIKPGKTQVQKDAEKKYGKGASAMNIVKAEIRAKYGKGTILGDK